MAIVARSSALLRWPQQQHVPLGGSYNVYGDAATGTVNYSTALNVRPIPAWPDGEGKVGLGLARCGYSGLGWGDGGPGLGVGGLGLGLLGYGALLHVWRTGPLADGTHKLAVVGLDPAGNKTTPATIEQSVALAGTPRKPTNLAASAYDSETDTLTLTWTISKDDDT